MNLTWADVTSYSQGQRGKAQQTAWETKLQGVRIWVSCGHLYYNGRWVMNCEYLKIRETDLGSVETLTSEQARDQAIHVVCDAAKKLEREARILAEAAHAANQLSN